MKSADRRRFVAVDDGIKSPSQFGGLGAGAYFASQAALPLANDVLRTLVSRIRGKKAEVHSLNTEIREIYAEAKASGVDKTALGQVVMLLEKREKDPAAFAERSELVERYLEALDETGTLVATHAHEPQLAAPEASPRTTDTDSAAVAAPNMHDDEPSKAPVCVGTWEVVDLDSGATHYRPSPEASRRAASAHSADVAVPDPDGDVSAAPTGFRTSETIDLGAGRAGHGAPAELSSQAEDACQTDVVAPNLDGDDVSDTSTSVGNPEAINLGVGGAHQEEPVNAAPRAGDAHHADRDAPNPKGENVGATPMGFDTSEAVDLGFRAARRPGQTWIESSPPNPVRWHPFLTAFPDHNDIALTNLRDDIRRHGVRRPIVKQGDTVLDGRSRYDSARTLGIAYEMREYDGTDVLADIIRWNVEDRGAVLDRESVADKLIKLVPERAGEIAFLLGVDSKREGTRAEHSPHSGTPQPTTEAQEEIPADIEPMEEDMAIGGRGEAISEPEFDIEINAHRVSELSVAAGGLDEVLPTSVANEQRDADNVATPKRRPGRPSTGFNKKAYDAAYQRRRRAKLRSSSEIEKPTAEEAGTLPTQGVTHELSEGTETAPIKMVE